MASQENNQDAYFAQLAEAMVEFDLGRNDVALNLYFDVLDEDELKPFTKALTILHILWSADVENPPVGIPNFEASLSDRYDEYHSIFAHLKATRGNDDDTFQALRSLYRTMKEKIDSDRSHMDVWEGFESETTEGEATEADMTGEEGNGVLNGDDKDTDGKGSEAETDAEEGPHGDAMEVDVLKQAAIHEVPTKPTTLTDNAMALTVMEVEIYDGINEAPTSGQKPKQTYL